MSSASGRSVLVRMHTAGNGLPIEVKKLLSEHFFHIGNIDVTVIAQKPKISPYIKNMEDSISNVLNLEKSRINIKGTTTEKLGFIGREEGIAAEAVCSIYR